MASISRLMFIGLNLASSLHQDECKFLHWSVEPVVASAVARAATLRYEVASTLINDARTRPRGSARVLRRAKKAAGTGTPCLVNAGWGPPSVFSAPAAAVAGKRAACACGATIP